MLDVQIAVEKARECFEGMFKSDAIAEVLLEEVTLSEDNLFWMITFSFDWQPHSGTSSIGPGARRYKQLQLDAEKGLLISMKTAQQYQ